MIGDACMAGITQLIHFPDNLRDFHATHTLFIGSHNFTVSTSTPNNISVCQASYVATNVAYHDVSVSLSELLLILSASFAELSSGFDSLLLLGS